MTVGLFIQVEYAFHGLPFLGGRTSLLALLEHCHVVLPFGLAREGGESCHCGVPFEVEGSFHYNEQFVVVDVYLHFEDAHLAYAFAYLRPVVVAVVRLDVFFYELFVVSQFQCLAVAFCRAAKLFY